MDAYYDYISQLTEAKLSDLRREADAFRLARSLKANGQARIGRGRFALLASRLRSRSARRIAAGPMGVDGPHPVPDELRPAA